MINNNDSTSIKTNAKGLVKRKEEAYLEKTNKILVLIRNREFNKVNDAYAQLKTSILEEIKELYKVLSKSKCDENDILYGIISSYFSVLKEIFAKDFNLPTNSKKYNEMEIKLCEASSDLSFWLLANEEN